MRAYVVRYSGLKAALEADLASGTGLVFKYGEAKIGHRFDQLVILAHHEHEWEDRWLDDMRLGLKPGGEELWA